MEPSGDITVADSGHVVMTTVVGDTVDHPDHCNGYTVQIRVNRPVYTKQDFNRKYNIASASPSNADQSSEGLSAKSVFIGLRHRIQSCCLPPSKECVKKSALSLFPFVRIMQEYSVRNDLLSDVMAGLIVGVMHIPQGMAYGMLTKLDPVYGLYASFFPVICYFFFGTSKHISIGTFAVISLMIGKVVEQSDCGEMASQSHENESFYDANFTTAVAPPGGLMSDYAKCQIGVAMAVSFLVGIIQILLGVFRFGFVTIYLSDPLTRALTMSAAVHVATSQIRHMFGISMGRFSSPLKLVYMYITFFKNINKTNVAALLMCVIAMVIIYSVQTWVNPRVKRKIKMPIPIELLVIIVSTLISYLATFNNRFEVEIVGDIPTGIPAPEFPPASKFSSVAGDAIGIAIVAFTINISMAKLFAKKHSYHLNSNQELLAYGIANTACSMLNCYVSTASLSRSLVQEAAGGKTQVAGLVSCSLLLVVLLALAPLFHDLPKCILAAIVLVNLKGVLMQITDIKTLYKSAQYYDLVIWIVTALAVILTDVDTGLYIGLGFSLLTIVFRTQRPHTSILGRIPHTDFYEDIKSYPSACEVPGIKVFRFNASLYYANAEHFSRRLYKKTRCNPGEIKRIQAQQKRRFAEVEKIRTRELEKKSKAMKAERRTKSDAKEEEALEQNTLAAEVFLDNDACIGNTATGENTIELTMPTIQNVILDFSSVMFIDTVGVSAMQQVVQDYKDIGVRVLVACCREDVYEKLEKAGTFKKNDNFSVFVGIHDAVLAAVESNSVLQQQMRIDSNGVLGSVLEAYFEADHGADKEHLVHDGK